MDSLVTNMNSKVTNMDSVSTDTGVKHRGGELSVEEALKGTACEKDICKNCFEFFYDFNRFMSETVIYLCSTCGAIFVPPGIAVSEKMIDKITKKTTQDVPQSRHPPSVPNNGVRQRESPQFSDEDNDDNNAGVVSVDDYESNGDIPVPRSTSAQYSFELKDPSDEDEDNDAYNACADVTLDDDSDRPPVLKSPNDPVVGVKNFITGTVSSTPIVTTSKKGKPLLRLSIPNTRRDSKIINGNVPSEQELKEATVQSFSNLLKSSEVTKFYVRVETPPKPDQNSYRPAGPVKEGMSNTTECVYGPGTESGGKLKDAEQPENCVVSGVGITQCINQPEEHSCVNSEDVSLKKAKCVMSDTSVPYTRECKNQLEGDSHIRPKRKGLLKKVGHKKTVVVSKTRLSRTPENKNQPEGQSVIRSELRVLLKDIRHMEKVSDKSKQEREPGLPEDMSDTEDCILSDSMPDITECKYQTEREPGISSEQGLPEDMSDKEVCVMSDTSMPDITEYKYQPEGAPGGSSEQVLSKDMSDTEECVMSDTRMPDLTECKYQPERAPGGSSEQGIPKEMIDAEESVLSDTSIPDITECANQLMREPGSSSEEVLLKDKELEEKCVVSNSSIPSRSECNTKLEREFGPSSEQNLPEDMNYMEECPLPNNCIPVTVAMLKGTVATKESLTGGGVFEDTEHNGCSPCLTSYEPEVVVVGNSVQESMEHTGHLENSSLCKNETVRNIVKTSEPDDIKSTESIEISYPKCNKQVQVQHKLHNENQRVVFNSQQEPKSVTHLSALTGITYSDNEEMPMSVMKSERQVEGATVMDIVEESTDADMVGECTVTDMEVKIYEEVKGEEDDQKLSCSESDNFMDTLEFGSEEFNKMIQSGSADHSYSHQSKKKSVARATKFPRQKSAYKMTSATKVHCRLCRKTFPSSSKCFEHVRKVHFLDGTHLNIKQKRISETRVKLPLESERHKPSQITEEVFQELTSQLAPEAYLDAGLMAKLTDTEELRHKFICGICKEGFMTIELVNQHSQIQHPGELVNVIQVQLGHVCEFCGKEEETKAKLQDHYKTHHKNYIVVCELCKKEFSTISEVHLHAKTEHPTEKFVSVVKKRKTFKCNVCGKKVMSKYSLIQHMRIHTGENPYVCDICGKRAKTHGSILSHKRCVHPTEEDKIAKARRPTFTCTVCHKEVMSKGSLDQHMRLHTGEKPYQCGACGKCYASNSAVHVHIRRVHTKEKPKPKEKTIFTCKECGKEVTTKASLNEHMLIHTGERPHPCPHCDQRFRTNSSLKAHVRTHTEKQFKCEECGKSFSERYLLKQHMNVHTKEKSDQCSYCGKVFYDTSVFKGHVRRVHERGDKYQCNVCNKPLSSRFSLQEHMRVHSGNRPYSCKVCSQTFKTCSACRAHEKRHSIVGNVYECPKCSKGFRSKHGFQKHVRNNCYQDTGSKVQGKQPVKNFQCVYCEKTYFSEEKLRKHVARHVVESSSEEEEPSVFVSGKSGPKTNSYSCSQCDKQYKTARGLRKHKEKHEKEAEEEGLSESEDERTASFMDESRSSRKMYECGHCGKEYKNKRSLKKHEQKHVEELSSENENEKSNLEDESLLDDWNI